MATPAATDFLDYIFQFASAGAFLGDPKLQPYVAQSVELLVYNPVTGGPTANSVVPLSGFWGMFSLQGFPGPTVLTTHPNLQILNDRTLMFARQPSVISTNIAITNINLVIDNFGVYVANGLQHV